MLAAHQVTAVASQTPTVSLPTASTTHNDVAAYRLRQSAEFKRRVANLAMQRRRNKRNEDSLSGTHTLSCAFSQKYHCAELDSDFDLFIERRRRRRRYMKKRARRERTLARIARQQAEVQRTHSPLSACDSDATTSNGT